MTDKYTPEEIDEIVDAYHQAIKNGTPITAEMSRAMKDAAIGIKGYTSRLNDSFKSLGKSTGNLVGNLKDGAQGAAVFNDSVTGMADVLGKLLSRIPYIGKALDLAVNGIARYATEATKQSDALFKSYQDLTRFGQGTAEGMDSVFSTMQKFSYGIGELDQMTALLRENSKSLAQFGGTVAQGTEQIANTANQFKTSGLQKEFQKMGVTVDNQNRAIAGYIRQLTNLGQNQGKTQDQLRDGAAAYLREMEGLTRLTGQTREEMEAQREQAMAVDQFAVTVSDMGDQGKELQKVFNMLMSVDPSGAKARAFAESVSGFMTGSKEQTQLFQASGGALFRLIEDLKRGTISAGQAVDQMFPKGTALEIQKSLARLGTGADMFGPISVAIKGNARSFAEAEKAADKQTQVTGEATDAAVDLRQSQMRTRNAMQIMINDGVLPATRAMAKLAGTTETAAEASKGFWDKSLGKLLNWFGGKSAADTATSGAAGSGSEATGGTASVGQTGAGARTVTYGSGETRIGGDRNWRNNNPGNIEYGAFAIQMGAIGSDGRFAIFPSEEMGRRAADALLKGETYSRLSAADAIKKWAPPSENDSGSYIKNVAKMANLDMTKRYVDMSVAEQGRFLDAMKTVEGGQAGKIVQGDTTASTTTGNVPKISSADTVALDQVRASQQRIPNISGANGFEGTLTGPTSGYRPNITMHGTEDLKITPQSQQDQQTAIPAVQNMISQQTAKLDQMIQALSNGSGQQFMAVQLDKLDQMIQVLQKQVNISQKILQQSQ